MASSLPSAPTPSSDHKQVPKDVFIKEIHQALAIGKKKRQPSSSSTSTRDCLEWLLQQSSGEEGGLFPLFAGDRSKITIIERQTFKKWKSLMQFERLKHPRRQQRRVIIIQPFSYHSSSITSSCKDNTASAGERRADTTPSSNLLSDNSIASSITSVNNNTAPDDNTISQGNHSIVAPADDSGEISYKHAQISDSILELLRDFCMVYFSGMEVELAPSLDLSEIPNLTSRIHQMTNRRQFSASDIISFLNLHRLRRAYCVLGVTVVDLYPSPEWNFVLGEASLEKGSGVFSFGRYFNDILCSVPALRSGRGAKEEEPVDEWEHKQIQNLWVLMRVMSHELCHLFGLTHCHYFQCAMNESGSITEAATQPLFLCPICLRKMNKMLKFDLAERYSALSEISLKIRGIVVKSSNEEKGHRDSTLLYDQREEESFTVESSAMNEVDDVQQEHVDSSMGCGRGTTMGDSIGKEDDSISKEDGTCHKMEDENTSTSSGHLERLDAAIEWLKQATQSIRDFYH